MRKPEEPDRKLFWSMILLGLVCTAFGVAFAGLTYATAREEQDLRRWVDGTAALTEIGIRTTSERHGSGYQLLVRYQLRVDGRDYEGHAVSGGSGASGVQVRSLILPYAPEAASFNLDDLGLLTPSRTWRVPFKSAPVRYDPKDPARSRMILTNPIVHETVGTWLPYILAAFFLLSGAVLLIFAWPARRGTSKPKPPTGPRLREYPEADRQRVLQSIAVLQAQIAQQTSGGSTPEMRSYAENIEEMAAEARDGSLTPQEHANTGLGRGASEIFNDGRLSDAASTVEACLNELARRKRTP